MNDAFYKLTHGNFRFLGLNLLVSRPILLMAILPCGKTWAIKLLASQCKVNSNFTLPSLNSDSLSRHWNEWPTGIMLIHRMI